MTRDEAESVGAVIYQGRACVKCGSKDRYTNSNRCVPCVAAQTKKTPDKRNCNRSVIDTVKHNTLRWDIKPVQLTQHEPYYFAY